jgi:hypothetical protein
MQGLLPVPKSRTPIKPSYTGTLDRILKEAIYPYHLLTARQITRLLYPTKPGNLTAVQTRLKALADAKLLNAAHLPTAERVRPYVYFFAQAARKLLQEEGYEINIYFQPSEVETRSPGWYYHLLEVNNFDIAAATLEKFVPTVQISNFLHDFTIAKNPPASIKKDSKIIKINPDSFLQFKYQKGERTLYFRFFLELDRGTESRSTIIEKVIAYLTLFQAGILHKYLDIPSERKLIVLFATTAGEKRVEYLREATRDAFKAYDETISATSYRNQQFFFASIPALMQEQPTPETIFCSPFWYLALDNETNQKNPLIDLQALG